MNKILILLAFIAITSFNKTVKKHDFTDKFWFISKYKVQEIEKKNQVYCENIFTLDNFTSHYKIGFKFSSDGTFNEYRKLRDVKNSKPYVKKWVLDKDTIKVKISEKLEWYFYDYKVTSNSHFVAKLKEVKN